MSVLSAPSAEALSGGASSHSWAFEEGEDIWPGRYAVTLLGGGRRYEAYLAFDETLLCLVVVKILRPDRAGEGIALEGLRDEYRSLKKLDHPSIARGFDAVLEGPRPHLVLEFLEGPRLSTLLRKHGRLPLEQWIPLAVQLSSALHYMHTKGVVHLDVKPSNTIMAAPPRLIDLSIARTFEQARNLDTPIGTDAYMAPEQCVLRADRAVGPRADVWGLGVTLYEAVSGILPWPKVDGQRFPQLAHDPLPLPHDVVPPGIAALIAECLRPNPTDRPDPRAVAGRLEPFVAALPRRPVLNRLRPRHT